MSVSALLGILYAEEKERLDFVYTIYHWLQAIAIFVVYLWADLPMRVSDYISGGKQQSKDTLFLHLSIFIMYLHISWFVLLTTFYFYSLHLS